MSNAWHVRIGGWLCFSALALGCGDSGSETPNPGDGVGDADGAGDGSGDGSGDADGSGDTTADGDNDGSGGDTGDEGDGGGDGPGSIAGDYWMRSDIEATLTQTLPLIGTVIVKSDITAYSLVRVTQEGGGYQMVDWQCHVTTEQNCEQTCTTASTEARDGETRSFAPSKRTLTVNGNSWSTDRCAQAVGWQWDCASGSDADPPTIEGDVSVYNPAGGEPGVDVTAVVEGLTCMANVVQKIDLTYEGSFAGGALSTGVVNDQGSSQNVLGGTCGTVPEPVPTGPGTLRIVPAQSAIAAGDDWECPSLADFQQALPNP